MNNFKTLLLIVSLCIISGCAAPVMLFGGIAGAGATLSKEQTVGSTVDDHNIWTKIKAGFLEHNKEVEGILTNVSVEVSEGRVLLTGFVKTPEERLIILKIVWQQAGVREVINEIKLEGETNQLSLKQYSKDAWITTQVKSKMLLNHHVRSINFSVETIEGTVYVLGIARTEEELHAIREIAESVEGVSKFVSYIRVNSNHQVKEKTQVINKSDEKKMPSEKSAIEPDENETPHKPEKEAKKTEVNEDEIEIEYLDSDD